MISITFTSVPPSLNNAYTNVRGRGRVPTKKLLNWKEAAGWELLAQRPGKIAGPVSIEISMLRPSKTSDVDNRAKAAIDLLVAHQIIQDDRFVESVKSSWARELGGPACRIVVAPAYPDGADVKAA